MKHQSQWILLRIITLLLLFSAQSCKGISKIFNPEPTPLPPTLTPLPTPKPTASPTPIGPRTVTLTSDGTGEYPDLSAALADLMPGQQSAWKLAHTLWTKP
jgi:hypothetical protein